MRTVRPRGVSGWQSSPVAYAPAQSAPVTASLPITILCFAALVVMMVSARKRTGFFINGYRKGRTRGVTIPLLVAVETIYIASLWLKESQHISWAPLVGGAMIVPVVIFATYRWQDAYRSEFDSSAATFAREKR